MPEYINLRNHQVYNYEWDHEDEAVVLLHGGLSKTSAWDYLMVPPLEDGFHVVVPSLGSPLAHGRVLRRGNIMKILSIQ